MKNQFQINFDCRELAHAFGVKEDDIHEFMTDGRRASFIIERRLKWAHEGWELAPGEGAGYDLLSPEGKKWEVRSITRLGVYFNPSGQVGSGRKFDKVGFFKKLDEIEGYILSDITKFPNIPVYVVPEQNVRRWYDMKKLGKNAKISRKKFLEQLLGDVKY